MKLRNVCMIAVAAVLLSITPLLAASPGVLSIPRPAVSPGQQTMADFVASSVMAGMQDPALPCFNCVSGASVVSLGVAAPISIVHASQSLAFSVTGDDVVYTGPCTFTYTIATKPDAPPVQSGSVSTICYPSIWIAWFPTTAPSSLGRYFLKGAIYTGNGGTLNHTVISASLIVVQ